MTMMRGWTAYSNRSISSTKGLERHIDYVMMGIAEDTAIAILREESVPRVEPSFIPFVSRVIAPHTNTEQRWCENTPVPASADRYNPLPQASGVTVNQECLEVFQELKLRKKHKYIIFGLNDAKTEIIKLKESRTQDYEDFLTDLPENECRWAVYDFEFQKEEGGLRNKIVFFHWYVLVANASSDTLKLFFFFSFFPYDTDGHVLSLIITLCGGLFLKLSTRCV
jgi:hypothetical protein